MVETLRVFTDSCASLPQETAAQNNIGVIPAAINIGKMSYREGIDMSSIQLLDMLPRLPELPQTAAPPPSEYNKAYKTVDPQTGIISVHLGSGFSNIYNAAVLASRDEPSGRVSVFDSGTVSMGIGFMAIRATELAEQGATREQILAELEDLKTRTRVMASFATLKNVEKGGRAPKIVTQVGEFLEIKPIIEVDHNLFNRIANPRSLSRSHRQLVELTEALGRLERVAVMFAGPQAEADADAIVKQIRRFYNGDIIVGDIGAVLTVHGGLGIVGICSVQTRK